MWKPQPGAQLIAWTAHWCDELFYGGERGGGKSDLQIGFQEDGALTYGKAWRGIMFRKTFPELEELQARASEVFPGEGAVFKTQPSADYPFSSCWYWPSGASVKMRYIENDKDYGRYHGHQYTGISFDEVTEYATPAGLLKMLSTLRSPHGVPCRVRLTGNPGGIGHVWVKQRYISPAPPMTPYNDPETGFTRMFVPSKTADNQILMKADPAYRSRILAATGGNEALRRAWLEGDWDIVAGAFFDNITPAIYLPTWNPPSKWTRYRSMDWGSARPFSVGWWAIADDDHYVKLKTGGEVMVPRGSIVRYREWYGCKEGEPNVGLKLDAEVVARGIKDREAGEKIDEQLSVADPSMWKEDGGPSIAERMIRALPDMTGPRFKPADNTRVTGWQQVRARINGDGQRPMLFVTDNCLDWKRTVPACQHDKNRIEDIDTDGEDHCFAGDTLVDCADGPVRIADLAGRHAVALRSPSGGQMLGINARLTRRNAEVVRLTFEDGTQIVCTHDHRFETAEGWRQAIDLRDAIRYDGTCSKSCPTPVKSSTAFATTDAGATSSERASGCIGWCGSGCAETSRLGITSTTSTATRPTTASRTCSFCGALSTCGTTVQSPASAGNWRCRLRRLLQRLGMGRTTARSGTESTTSATALKSCTSACESRARTVVAYSTASSDGNRSAATPASRLIDASQAPMMSSASALTVVPRLRRTDTPLPRLAPENVGTSWRRLRVLRVEPAGRADVYCLTVPVRSAFTVEGGISVHNCADDTRYACMARPMSRVPKPRELKGPKPFTLDWLMQQKG